MAIDFTSDFPLLIIGTEVVDNPSFEDWSSASACDDWTTAGGTLSNTTDERYVHPVGSRSLILDAAADRAGTAAADTYAEFGLTAMPSWADGFIAVCAYYRDGVGGTNDDAHMAIGATNGAVLDATASEWHFGYVEAAGPTTGTLVLNGPTTGDVYFDNLMMGFYIDLDIYFKKWNPIDRTKKEKRDTPYNHMTQLYSDAFDLKATTIKFGTTLREKLLGAWQYLQKGHYFACILDRANSAPYRDEWMPYLSLNSQDSPKFFPGAPDVYTMGINGRGNLP